MRELEDDWDAAAPPARPSPSDSPELERNGARPRQQAALASYRQPPRGSELPHQDVEHPWEHQVDPSLSLTLTLSQACGAPQVDPTFILTWTRSNLSTLTPLNPRPHAPHLPPSHPHYRHSAFTLSPSPNLNHRRRRRGCMGSRSCRLARSSSVATRGIEGTLALPSSGSRAPSGAISRCARWSRSACAPRGGLGRTISTAACRQTPRASDERMGSPLDEQQRSPHVQRQAQRRQASLPCVRVYLSYYQFAKRSLRALSKSHSYMWGSTYTV